MTNVNELKDALKETLEENGTISKIRAMMRESIFNAIESHEKPKPKLSDENLLINELIREYMIYNNYLHSNSVFISESGQPVDPPFDRHFISKELNILEDNSSQQVPLLYSILFGLKKEVYLPNEGSMQMKINSNMNPMSMVAQSNQAFQMPTQYKEQAINQLSQNQSNVFNQQKDQPKPWSI